MLYCRTLLLNALNLCYTGPVDRPPIPSPPRLDTGQALPRLMREQLRLSICCAASFLVLCLGPLFLISFGPELRANPFFGFPLSWLLLGILFFPFVWLISWIFIRRSTQLEREEIADATRSGAWQSGPRH